MFPPFPAPGEHWGTRGTPAAGHRLATAYRLRPGGGEPQTSYPAPAGRQWASGWSGGCRSRVVRRSRSLMSVVWSRARETDRAPRKVLNLPHWAEPFPAVRPGSGPGADPLVFVVSVRVRDYRGGSPRGSVW